MLMRATAYLRARIVHRRLSKSAFQSFMCVSMYLALQVYSFAPSDPDVRVEQLPADGGGEVRYAHRGQLGRQRHWRPSAAEWQHGCGVQWLLECRIQRLRGSFHEMDVGGDGAWRH
jgi:hypothetical protein